MPTETAGDHHGPASTVRVHSGAAAALRLGLLSAFLLLLIWPAGVADPFRAGSAWSWTVVCLLTAAPILCLAALHRDTARTPLDVLIALYLAAVVATWPTAFDRQQTLVAVAALAGNLAMFYAAVVVARRHPMATRIVLIVFVLGIAVLELLAADYHFQFGALQRPDDYPRPAGWSGYPELGLLAAIAFAIVLAVSQAAQPWWSRAALLALVAVSLLELAFLYSRMAWVSVAGVTVAMILVACRARRFAGVAAAIVVMLLVGGGLVAGNSSIQRLAAGLVGMESLVQLPPGVVITPATPSERFDIWRRTLRMIRDHRALGVGLGNFQAVYEPNYNPEINNDGRRGVHAHNLWLHQTAELGLAGGAAYLAVWVGVLALAWRRSRFSFIDQALFYIVVAVAVRSLGDNMFFTTGGAPARLQTLTWLCFGLIAGRSGGAEVSSPPVPAPSSNPATPRWNRLAIAFVCALFAGEIYGLFGADTGSVIAAGRKPIELRQFGEGVPIDQTFVMAAGGLRSIRVQMSSDRNVSVRVGCELFQQTGGPGGPFEWLAASTIAVNQGAGRTWQTCSFRPVGGSAGGTFKVRLRLLRPLPSGRPVIGLVAWLDDALGEGALSIAGREQWGDLRFEARGERQTVYAAFRRHTGASLPTPLRSLPIQLILLLTYNCALLMFVRQVSRAGKDPAESHVGPITRRAPAPPPIARRRLMIAAAASLAIVVMAAVAAGREGRRSPERIAVDLVAEFEAADKLAPVPLHQAFGVVEGSQRAIFAHPPSRVIWKTTIPAGARLRTSLELMPAVWDKSTDGVVFRIGISDGHGYISLIDRLVDPMHVPDDRRAIPVEIDLTPYAGREMELFFNTATSTPGSPFDAGYDWALWGDPRIVLTR
ncbi:MAG: O-antigen ligase family protein [Acidobacteriota bacterium]